MNAVNDAIRRSQADSTLIVTGTAGGSTTLTAGQRRVKVTPPSSGTHTINVPTPKDFPGDFVDIETPTDGAGTVTVVATGLAANPVLTAAADHVVLWSNGESWRLMVDVTT